jgi:lambda repressor-like predicted transcriptional regulator
MRNAEAKEELRRLGWSQRRAARKLGVHWVHLSKVLNGHRQSRRLINAIFDLPHCPTRRAA